MLGRQCSGTGPCRSASRNSSIIKPQTMCHVDWHIVCGLMIELFRDAERHGPVPEHWRPNIDYPAELKERERVALNTLFLEPICVTVGQRQDYVNGQHRTHAM